MIIKGLLLKFLSTNKIVYLYVFLSCISMFLQVIVSTLIYRKFLEKNIKENFYKLIKQICILWISMFVIYIIRSKIECSIAPDVNTFVRRELIINYLHTNEVHFNDKEAEKDHIKMIEAGYYYQKLFIWIFESIIPIIVIMIIMNIYFLIKCPSVGIINFISNIINIVIIVIYYPKLRDIILKRRTDYNNLVVNMGENINNLINIYTSGSLDKTVDKNDSLMNIYKKSLTEEITVVCDFINTLRVNVYTSTLLSIISLYKTTKRVEDFFDIFAIFVLYIPVFQNVISEIPKQFVYLTDMILIFKNFVKNKKLTVDDKGYLATLNYPYKYNDDNLHSCKGKIVIDNITFSYDKSYIFTDFSLTINPMERIGIMAESGRGKTTLMKLLLNFIKPQKGNILLDGIDIKEINHRTLRERIKYINQKTLLLNDTIIDNFKYGNNKTTQQIIDFLKKYNLEKLFPDLETMVDMNGKNISMGMQKIIYLVRNILNDKCCVYIFDEPLTSLDENTRDSVIKMIDENTKNKTVIVITHDKQILKILNRVINL